jgi:Radical SAM superfamily/4Fe-4S single cluster domain
MSEKHSSKNEPAFQRSTIAVIERLEMHVTHSCNLSCESCCHYSNHNHKGHIDVLEAEAWMSAWRGRFMVNEFVLLGGEPTLNPELPRFVPLVRKYWPEAKLILITNGFFLHRHPDLPQALADYGDAHIALSVHHDSSMYQIRLQPIFNLIEKWRQDYGISIVLTDSHRQWTRRYLGYGSSMLPFEDNDARKSWEICPARDCKQLFDGKLWKCAPIAYLHLQKQKFDLSSKWDRYLNHSPLNPASDNQALIEFIKREDESICSMCSAKQRNFELPNPITSRPQPDRQSFSHIQR